MPPLRLSWIAFFTGGISSGSKAKATALKRLLSA
jgi:hypothetical protein